MWSRPPSKGHGPADLVGLRRLRQPVADLLPVPLQYVDEGSPRGLRFGRAAHARIVSTEFGRPSFEHDPVYGAEQPERERRGSRVPLVSREDLGGGAARGHVVGRAIHEFRVERRAELGAGARLRTDVLDHR